MSLNITPTTRNLGNIKVFNETKTTSFIISSTSTETITGLSVSGSETTASQNAKHVQPSRSFSNGTTYGFNNDGSIEDIAASDTDYVAGFGLPDNEFKSYPAYLSLDTVADFTEGDTVTLEWSGFGWDSVKLEYNLDGAGWTSIATGQTGTSYDWDTSGIGTGTLQVRVVDENESRVSDSQSGITVESGDVYIVTIRACDQVEKRLLSDDSIIQTVGSSGSGDENFNLPDYCAVNDTHVFISDYINQRIVKRLKSDMSYVSKVSLGSTTRGIAVDSDYVYACCCGSNLIKKYTLNFGLVDTISVTRPSGICIYGDYIYVAELTMKRVRKILKTSPYTQSTLISFYDFIDDVDTDGSFVYFSSNDVATGKVYKCTMAGSDTGVSSNVILPSSVKIIGDYVYVPSGDQIWKLSKDDLSTSAEVSSYGSYGIGYHST